MILFLLPNLLSSVIFVFLCSAPTFFASPRRSQVYYAQPLDPRHWSLISTACHAYCIYCCWLLLLEKVEFIVLNLSPWDWFFFVMCKFVIHFLCVINITLQLLNVLVEVEFKTISLFWSVASISLVHRNPLCEHCPGGWGNTRGKCTISHQVVYRICVEFWAQHPPHTNSARV